jgi:hypothetical protein
MFVVVCFLSISFPHQQKDQSDADFLRDYSHSLAVSNWPAAENTQASLQMPGLLFSFLPIPNIIIFNYEVWNINIIRRKSQGMI